MSTAIQILRAGHADRDELRAMQAASMRILGAPFYEPEVIESFIADVGTMDDGLLDEATYFKVVADGRIVASGGWSRRTPAYQARAEGAAPPPATATVRSVFVHPDHARRGIARTILALVEDEIARAGFPVARLTATLSGVPFYRRLGYRSGRPVTLRLAGQLEFPALAMEKPLALEADRFATLRTASTRRDGPGIIGASREDPHATSPTRPGPRIDAAGHPGGRL